MNAGPTKRQLEVAAELADSHSNNVPDGTQTVDSDSSEDHEGDSPADVGSVAGPTQGPPSSSGNTSSGLNLAAVLLILVAGIAVGGAVYLAVRQEGKGANPSSSDRPVTLEGWVPPVGPMA